MKNSLPALLSLAMIVVCPAAGGDPPLAPPALPVLPAPVKITEPAPVPVPETIGASVLAGVGFLMMFARRRYS